MKEQRNKTRIEGDGASQLIQLIRKHGYNQDVNFELGTVTASPPALKIKLDGVDSFELDADDLIVAEHLTDHTRTVSLKGSNLNAPTNSVNDGGSGASSHSHELTSFEITDATISSNHALNTGDRVIIASYNSGQQYIVLDKAVRFNDA